MSARILTERDPDMAWIDVLVCAVMTRDHLNPPAGPPVPVPVVPDWVAAVPAGQWKQAN